MAAIPWATTVAALDDELGDATGATRDVGQEIRNALNRLGQEYDSRFAAPVSSAKDAFTALVTAAHDEADRVCRYAESLAGTPGPPLPVDIHSSAAIVARCDKAIKASKIDALTRALQANKSRLFIVYAQGDSQAGTTWRYLTGRGTDAHPARRNYTMSVRDLEIEILKQIAAANDWIALVQYA